MADLERLKEGCDLRRLVEQDLGPAPRRGGRAHLWQCPFHNERRGFSLAVWPDGYRCFGACGISGDAIDWLMRRRCLSFHEALAVLGTSSRAPLPRPRQASRSAVSEPPSDAWQAAARQVVQRAEDTLWSPRGQPALTYLLAHRGLTADTVRQARLGYVPGGPRAWRRVAGLDVPCGITIPWWEAETLWAVKVRRAQGTPKYQQIAGSSGGGLYGVDHLPSREVALFCEGEFDVLVAQQEAGTLVAPVALSSAAAALNPRWYSRLAHCCTLLVAYDRDPAGEAGARRLLALSARFRPAPVPHGKDLSEFYLSGGDVRAWIAALV